MISVKSVEKNELLGKNSRNFSVFKNKKDSNKHQKNHKN